MLGDQLGLPVYSLDEAKSQLSDGCPVIYLGWIHASRVKGYSKSASRLSVCAVCGVGLWDIGTLMLGKMSTMSNLKTLPTSDNTTTLLVEGFCFSNTFEVI